MRMAARKVSPSISPLRVPSASMEESANSSRIAAGSCSAASSSRARWPRISSRYVAAPSIRRERNTRCMSEKPEKPNAFAKRMSVEGCTEVCRAVSATVCRAKRFGSASAYCAIRCRCGLSVSKRRWKASRSRSKSRGGSASAIRRSKAFGIRRIACAGYSQLSGRNSMRCDLARTQAWRN